MLKPKITTPTESFVEHYPIFAEMADKQLDILWTWKDIEVEKDIQDILVNCTEAERHGIITTLRLFTLYELKVGADAWSGMMMKRYPRPEICRMSAVFSAIELGVHQPFYARINELLNLSTDEFYLSYTQDEVLKQRIDFIDSLLSSEDELVSTGVFTLIEGVVLYSSFAFLKHFQSQGKNKLTNVCRGIAYSVSDEALHAQATALLFRQHLEESYFVDLDNVKTKIIEACHSVYEHEEQIIEKVFELGEIEGITKQDMRSFVKSRINLCLRDLGYENLYEIETNPIKDWFYDNINNYQFVDFFVGGSKEYQRDWDLEGFDWNGESK